MSHARSQSQLQPRMRVFARPNSSGKSTVIESIRQYKADGKHIDFGYYINADDIARALRSKEGFAFHGFDIIVTNGEFQNIVAESGLPSGDFSDVDLEKYRRIPMFLMLAVTDLLH